MELILLLALPALVGLFSSSDDSEPELEAIEQSDALSAAGARQILSDLAEDDAAQDDIWWGDMARTDGTEADETVTGSAANDLIFGGAGNDLLELGDGENLSWVDARSQTETYDQFSNGDDTIIGGADQDVIWDIDGSNEIHGGGGNDVLLALDNLQPDPVNPESNLVLDRDGEATPDQIFGGGGDDTLDGDQGDTLSGGEGADLFWTWHYQDNAEPVEITDFSAEDSIILQVTTNLISQEAFEANPAAEVSTDPETGDVTVSHSGITLVVLKGPIVIEPGQFSISHYAA